ncbi:MAG: DUF4080 domain-containing protein [Culicoidibacterales bacterium]
MKTLLITQNAKYIHTSLALRWLYVVSKDIHDIDFKEYTIKDSIESIADDILSQEIDVLGISVSIWNVRQTKELTALLKQLKPELIIILGGPEVGYETEYFINNWNIDYIVSGEGEFVLQQLLTKLKEGSDVDSIHVASKKRPQAHPAQAPIELLETYESPYMLERDKESAKHRVIYFETSRGCPYNCQYCLSSLEKGVRYFSQEYTSRQLAYLFESEVKTVKFLDRTFNLKQDHTLFIFDTIKQLYNQKTICQFEIYADLLKPQMMDTLATFPKNFLRFEIGIQSTYDLTNKTVKRMQNFDKIAQSVNRLHQDGVVDLHLDLIAGLPYETYDRFQQSFNEVFELKAKELQLGFLKMLRGTKLRDQAELYGYLYDLDGPYEIYQHNDMSTEDIHNIKIVEDMLEKYWNSGKFSNTLKIVLEDTNYFQWFYQLGLFYQAKGIPHIGYQLSDLFAVLYEFLHPDTDVKEALFIDYYTHFKVKPKRFIEPTMNNDEKKRLIQMMLDDTSYLELSELNQQLLYKYTYFEKIREGRYFLMTYAPQYTKWNIYTYDNKENV